LRRRKNEKGYSFFIIHHTILYFIFYIEELGMTDHLMIWSWHTVAFLFQSGIRSKILRRRNNEKGYSFFILHHFVGRV